MLGDQHMFRKCWPYEVSGRVPYLVGGPQRDPLCSGVVSQAVVGMQDLMPTILDIAGASIPHSVTGRSVLPVMRGEAQTVRRRPGACAVAVALGRSPARPAGVVRPGWRSRRRPPARPVHPPP